MSVMLPRRALRPIARVLVVGWLLALAVSWVNACIVGPGSSQAAVAHHAALTGPAAEVAGVHGGAPHDAPSLAACQGFCDAVQGVVAKSPLQDASDLGWALPAAEHSWVPWPRRADTVASRAAAAPPPPALPVAIAFLRLNR